jgi:hypothetical protein
MRSREILTNWLACVVIADGREYRANANEATNQALRERMHGEFLVPSSVVLLNNQAPFAATDDQGQAFALRNNWRRDGESARCSRRRLPSLRPISPATSSVSTLVDRDQP